MWWKSPQGWVQRAIEWLDANALRKRNQYKAKKEEEKKTFQSCCNRNLHFTNEQRKGVWMAAASERIKNISHGIGWVSSDGIIRKVKKHIFMVISWDWTKDIFHVSLASLSCWLCIKSLKVNYLVFFSLPTSHPIIPFSLQTLLLLQQCRIYMKWVCLCTQQLFLPHFTSSYISFHVLNVSSKKETWEGWVEEDRKQKVNLSSSPEFSQRAYILFRLNT